MRRNHSSVHGVRRLRLSPVCCQVLLALLACPGLQAHAADYFDPALLNLGGDASQSVDLSQFENPGGQAEGSYTVDVWVNGTFTTTRNMKFVHGADGSLQPVLTPATLDEWGVNLSGQKDLAALPVKDPLPKSLAGYIPQADTKLDFSQMRLTVNVPQLYMKPSRDTLADPALWQEGDPAFLLNYSLSGNNYQNRGYGNSASQGMFGSFQSGLNLGPWRLRNTSSYSYSQQRYDRYDPLSDSIRRATSSQSGWATQQTYLQRDIQALRSELTLGETSTGSVAGQVLDGFSFRGVSLASSDSMSPTLMSGYAPVISGIARSNARVTITQNGYTIYQANVAPGPFRFTDINGGSTSGDLVVTVTEADGTTHGFRQPYSALPIMQRQGVLRYEAAAGQYYNGHGAWSDGRQPGFGMLTAIYGIPGDITLYGGGIGSGDYQSATVGTGFSVSSYGAVSLDVTHSRTTQEDGQTLSGESYRARYSRSLLSTGTTVDLLAYRYSTHNYMSFSDANNQAFSSDSGLPQWLNGRRRSSYEARVSQTLWSNYQLWLSGRQDRYWGSDQINTTLSAGLSGAIKQVGWSLNYSVDRIRGNGDWPENRQMMLSLNVPMSLFSSAGAFRNSYANYSMSHDNTGRTSNQVGVGGSFCDSCNMSWNVSQSQGNQGQGNSGSAGLGYSGDWGSSNLGYNYDSNGGRGITFGANGGLVAHRHGVTLTRNVGDAAAVVHTGVPGVAVMNGGAVTDLWGNAVVSSMQTYARNSIDIDPSSLPEGAMPPSGTHALYPTSGAIVVEDMPVRLGQQVLMNLMFNGRPVPFGASAGLIGDDSVGGSIVGEGGQVYMAGLPQKGSLLVQWGRAADAQCRVDFSLPAPVVRQKGDTHWHPIKTLDVPCR